MQYGRRREYTQRHIKPLDWFKDAFGRIVAFAIILPLSILFIKIIPYYLAIIEYLMSHTFIAILIGVLVIGILIGIWIFTKRKKQNRESSQLWTE
jgi:predicted transporter